MTTKTYPEFDAEKHVIKGCPFCDVPGTILEAPNHAHVIVYWVECNNYKCETSVSTHQCGTPAKAVAIWNRRGTK